MLREDVAAEAVAGCEKRLHLHDGGLACARAGIERRRSAGVVLPLVLAVDILHDIGYGITIGSVVFIKLLLRPVKRLVLVNAESVHPVDGARYVSVAVALHIFLTFSLHERTGSGSGLGARRSSPRLLLLGLERLDLQLLRHRTIYSPRIMSQAAQTVDIAALVVVFHAGYLLDFLVGREPCVLEVVLGHVAVHLHDYAQSVARDSAIGEAGILRLLHDLFHRRHLVGRDVVEIHNHKRHESRDVICRLAALHHSLWHNGWALLLDVRQLRLEMTLALLVALSLCLFIDGKSRLIFTA